MLNPNQISGYNDQTKTICLCSLTSIIIVILFIISPLSNLFLTSVVMKIIILLILIYTIYLNNQQTNLLNNANNITQSKEVNSQLNINIICSYVFTLFIGLLIIYVIKSFF